MPEPTSEAWARIRYEYERTTRPVEDICAEHGISSGTLRDRMRRWQWTRRRPPIPRDGPPPLAVARREITSPPPIRAANGGEGLGVGGLCAVQTAEPSPPTPLHLAEASRSDPPHRFAGGGMEHAAPPQHVSEMDEARSSEGENGAIVPRPASAANVQADAASIVQRLQGAVARVLPAIEAIIARLAAGPQHPREMEQAGRALGALMRTLRELNALLSQHNAQAAQPYDDMPEDMDAFRLDLARRIDAFVESRGHEIDEAEPEET
ncbi:MAG: hypothetical protein HYX37_12060 [Rhizobiales bacterium]|nr:hypothetical protein [Hyphomicrobiales bacterium]